MRVFSNTYEADTLHEYNRELYRLKFKWHMNWMCGFGKQQHA